MKRRLGIGAAVVAMSALMFACTNPTSPPPVKPTVSEFGIGGGACLVGSTIDITVQTTPVNRGTHALPTGSISLLIDHVTVDNEPLVPDTVDGTENVVTFDTTACPTAGQHTYSFSYSGDSVYQPSTQGSYDLLSIPASPDMGADVVSGVINVGGVGCAQDASVSIFGGAPGDPTPPQVATAQADVTSDFYWYTSVQLGSGTYELQANCLDGLGNPLNYNPVTVTVP